jgi:hypothetical protein
MIVGNRQKLVTQLRGRRFNLYFNDDMTTLTTPDGTVDLVNQLNNYTVDTTDTWLFRGYFIPDSTSTTWQFRTTSDDASFLWVGSSANALDTSLPTGSATVNNGGLHGSQTRTSGNLSLTSGVIYPFTVVAGNNTGPGSITVQWRPNTSTAWASNGDGFYFRNPKAVNGYNP